MKNFELSPEEIKKLRFAHRIEKRKSKAYRINPKFIAIYVHYKKCNSLIFKLTRIL